MLNGVHYKTNNPVKITFEKDLIASIKLDKTLQTDNMICPGLVDLQINGFKGVDFNEEGLSVDSVVLVTRELWKAGVTSYFPTLITNSDENICATLETIEQACEKHSLIDKTISGIHLEGPFLSSEDGPRGAHPLKHIKAPDWDLLNKWQTIARGRIKMITISPEWPESVNFIKCCRSSGILVAIGHTNANEEQIRNAVQAGARLSTHLGNATHLMLPRHSNYIWEQLASEQLWSSIIADGFHLPPALLKVFLKIKEGQSILVSDSTKFAGLPPGSYSSHIGGAIELNSEGRLFMKDKPKMLAGSARSLLNCIDHLVNSEITSLETALDMASFKPLELLGKHYLYGMEEGKKADLIIFKRVSGKIRLLKTIKAGEVVYKA
ncbi:N-acetylglucosamine-6-phosphate deacetylase [Gramella sp. KN1008]|uniref:N-acetylglucosamine-6-phosphate deacetylase n=1 Tax=Gramella sp. KN1008 TaxID=2529298 RepID=UPI00103B6FCF|nr:amidohydrolase family protein [Gramella sp. KN1008]TBW28632.1 N-acetylglucosamine-6-phosphate deacetylase [Gramella sp. KN1008]